MSNEAPEERRANEIKKSGGTEQEKRTCANEEPALIEILKRLQEKVDYLEDEVKILRNNSLRLKLEVIEIRRKIQLDEEDEAAYRTGDDILRRVVEGNQPTPVYERETEEAHHSGERQPENRNRGNIVHPDREPQIHYRDEIRSSGREQGESKQW